VSRRRTFLQFASSEVDADILYGSGFFAYDPFLYLEHRGRSFLVVTDFECDRARVESNADEVWPAGVLAAEDQKSRRRRQPDLTLEGLAAAALRRLKIRRVSVPGQFPVGMARGLERAGFAVSVIAEPAYPKRLTKTPEEISAITRVQRQVERAMRAAEAMLRRSRIVKNRLVLAGRTLTAGDLRRVINLTLMEAGIVAAQTVVAPGDQAVDPHNLGSGPIRPHQPVVIDIFPRSSETHYFADMTRTILKGRPSPALREQYRAVLQAQQTALEMIRPGVAVRTVHQAVAECFGRMGYPTGERDGRLQGFTHSTGHGVGLEIHEPPKIGVVSQAVRFRKNMVVTVEPGLYYLGTGGVRIEDLVVVEARGARNLTRYPKKLAI
jgi:Xaa-Pro aminopeptidase